MAIGYAGAADCFETSASKLWNPGVPRSVFGDVALVIFLLAQCFDGVFTYVGVISFGLAIEANPLIATLMAEFGHGTALLGAKSAASLLGITLHLLRVHAAVAVLAVFYVAVAILPWVGVLFF